MAEASRGTEASHWVTQTVHCPAQHISVAGSESGHSPPSPAHPSSSHKCGTAAGTPWLHPPPSTHRPAAHKSVRSLCEPAPVGSSHSHLGQLMTCHVKNFSLFYSNQLWGPSALSTFSLSAASLDKQLRFQHVPCLQDFVHLDYVVLPN